MSTVTEFGQLIARSADVRGGSPCIAGTGVSVRQIVGWCKLGLSPEGIADRIGHLTLAQIHAALAYYHANREEIEADIAAELLCRRANATTAEPKSEDERGRDAQSS